MIDAHAHLHLSDFPDRAEVLSRARSAGVDTIVVIGADKDMEAAKEAVALSESEPWIFSVVGIHPHYASDASESVLAEIEALAQRDRVVAVGETGLDYHYNYSPKEAQQAALSAFLRMAERVGKPAVLHVRDAHQDAANALREHGTEGAIIHCFTGGPDEAKAYVELGCYISLSGILTFRTAEAIRAAASWTPSDRVLVETDCPYLAPVPKRGKRNEPAYVRHTVDQLASLRGWSVEDTVRITAENTRRAFRLPAP